MKRQLILLLFAIGVSISMHAIPAKPGKTVVRQADGTYVTVVLHGDEHSHFTTTVDGYTLVLDNGSWQYALKQNGDLVSSGMTAHDAPARTDAEKTFLAGHEKMLRAEPTAVQQEAVKRSRSLWKQPATGTGQAKATRYDYNNFRGLVILVEWNDRSFTRSDAKSFFSSMVNDKGYSGYYTQDTPRQWVNCTGSVHDYFSDNSSGLFQPKFDVVGPVKINRSCKYPEGASYGWQCAVDAIKAADPLVDYRKYDADGDGVVDMFYIIYAGYGSNVSGNSSSYIWPYASQYVYPYMTYDGVRMGRYACSTEICDSEVRGGNTLDGIGTIVHEFSHVLGLPDLYDTDYEENGQSNDPGIWSIMAGGGYNNSSRTPTGYGAYERYAIGFMQPELIKEKGGTYTLGAMNETNSAYRINSAVDKEYFLLENRQRTRWDEYLPGNGMLVFRVDSTDASIWTSNKVNCYPSHNYYEMVRANPRTTGNVITESGYDSFPGLGNITELNSEMIEQFRSWSGEAVPLSLSNISEKNGIINFSVGGSEIDRKIEDFEDMALTQEDATGVKGVFCNWDMVNTRVVETTDKQGTGKKALSIVRGGSLTSSVIEKGISNIEFDFWNASPVQSIIRCYSSTDGGNTWTLMKNIEGLTQINVTAGKNIHTKYVANLPAGSMFRIQQDSGLPTVINYIDDISMIFNGNTATGIGEIKAENGTDTVEETVYNLSGQRVSACSKGILIVKKHTADGRVITRKVVRR
ncbi:M6 family metalloprotease domain-containing protein [Xylanibacter caecicola]|uniref:M6 family metalloprotease domain-containing protein n=1 Tax=Xylanibacter caecicola TaxID=2736294 RepID=UPI00258F9A39|nr:M6 family metalloprotease domain-containing protein [Xylanibacter caecicola]